MRGIKNVNSVLIQNMNDVYKTFFDCRIGSPT